MSVLRVIRLNLADAAVGAVSHPCWASENEAGALAAARRRLDAASEALRAAFPDLITGEADQAVINEWMAEGMSRRAARARLDRLVVANVGDAPAAHRVEVEVADHSALLTAVFYAHESPAAHAALRASLARSAAVVAQATGFHAPEPGAKAASQAASQAASPGGAAQAAAVADDLTERALGALRRDGRRGWLKFIGLNVMALACVAAVIWGGETMRRRLSPADVESAYTFVVRGQAEARRSRVPPEFPLVGVIRETGESAMVNVFRDAYVSAQRGGEFIVLRGSDPAEPWVELDRMNSFGPVLTLGPVALAPLTLVGVSGAALWAGAIGWFYRREQPLGRAMLRELAGVWLKYGAIIIVMFAVAVMLNL